MLFRRLLTCCPHSAIITRRVNVYYFIFILSVYYSKSKENIDMRTRKQSLGDRNIVGAKIEQHRKAIGLKQKDLLTQLQINGIDLNASGLSKLEGQLRYVTDFELVAIAKVLGVSVDWLLGIENDK